jgi:hypothetical protein
MHKTGRSRYFHRTAPVSSVDVGLRVHHAGHRPGPKSSPATPAPAALPAIEARFKGKGPWKKGLPPILETLEALGRARREGKGVEQGWRA